MVRVTMCAGLALLVLACGGNSSGGGEPGDPVPGLESIIVDPGDVTLTIDGQTSATAEFTAMGVFDDGGMRDITDQVSWGLEDQSLGTLTLNQFQSRSNFGGRSRVFAMAGDITGSAQITLKLEISIPVTGGVGGADNTDPPGPPDGAEDLFDGPASDDDDRKPAIVYPSTGVALPPNLNRLELHFDPGQDNTVFEIQFRNEVSDIKLYLVCGPQTDGGCIYEPDLNVWQFIAETNRGEGTVEMVIRGTDDAGTEVAASEPITLQFSQDDLRGAIYYWSTSREAILRWDFASTTQTEAELFFGDGAGTGTCVGCHAVSRDGRSITVQAEGQDSGDQFLLDVATREPKVAFPAPQPAVFTSWAPNGNQYVGVYDRGGEADGVDGDEFAGDGDDDQLLIIDGDTGVLTSVVQAGGSDARPTNHPDWAGTGDKIAFVRVGNDTRSLQKFHTGRVGFVAETAGVWGDPIWLTEETPGKNRYYPAFAPDGTFLAYNESTCPAGQNESNQCNADTDPSATLMFVSAALGAEPVVGQRANAGGPRDGDETNLANTFPKWSPFEFQLDQEFGRRLMWLTFSSTRRYGLRQPPEPPNTNESPKGTLIWMVAIDPSAVARGEDPTAAAFVLPFQDLSTSNHIAQWTEEAPPIVVE